MSISQSRWLCDGLLPEGAEKQSQTGLDLMKSGIMK